jgi:hypothetical protein
MNLKNKTTNETKKTVGVGFPDILYLQEFGSLVWFAFDEIPYHVGSSLTQREWRDVDVRVLLADDIYEEMFGPPDQSHQSGKWRALCQAFSALGEKMTGLPIDFQIQAATHANKLYSRPDHQRSSLGLVPLRMAKNSHDRTDSKAAEYVLKKYEEENMSNKERAASIIKDILVNHLPRVQEGLEKGYVDENQILVMYDHAVRARILTEQDQANSEPVSAPKSA